MFALNPEQKQHLNSKDFTFRILISMIVVKPFVNTFHELNIIAGITLLQFFSALFFMLLLIGILLQTKSEINSKVFFIFGFFFLMYFFNIFRVLVSNLDFSSLKTLSKISLFPLLYFYLKKYINSIIDYEIIINAFIKSSIPTIILGFVDFILIGDYQSNRDFDRFESSYGDIATLGLQLNILAIIMYYNILKDSETAFGKNIIYNVTLFTFSVFSLFKIAHGSSFGVFGALALLFIFFKLRKSLIKNLIILSVPIVALSYYVGSWIKNFSIIFFQRELLTILSGENILDKGYLFHGRVSRWIRHLNLFGQEGDFNQFFGGVGIKYPYLMEHGPHNDYLRILFSVGYIGLIIYLVGLLSLLFYSFKLKREDGFMLFSIVVLLLLYSVTLTPTTYTDVCVFFMTIVVYSIKRFSF